MSPEKKMQEAVASSECDHCGSSASHGDGDVLRCECGSLLARFVAGHIELKCRRCKRTITLPLVNASENRLG
jgi:hypothetical protein